MATRGGRSRYRRPRSPAGRGRKSEGRTDMMRSLGAGMLLALSALLPAQQAAAQDPLAGAAIGAATGAIIASEAQRRSGGYYWWHGGCYYQYPNGAWVQIAPNYCA